MRWDGNFPYCILFCRKLTNPKSESKGCIYGKKRGEWNCSSPQLLFEKVEFMESHLIKNFTRHLKALNVLIDNQLYYNLLTKLSLTTHPLGKLNIAVSFEYSQKVPRM